MLFSTLNFLYYLPIVFLKSSSDMATRVGKLLQRIFAMRLSQEDDGKYVSFDCQAFLDAIQEYKRHFEDDTLPKEKLFQLPDYLKPLAHIHFFHEVTKKVDCRNTPGDIVYVDMIRNPDKEIEFINRLVHDSTNGFFESLDPVTQNELHHPEFRFLLLGIFYLKAKWNGEDAETFPFKNRNGQVQENVPFFKLKNQEVKFKKDRIYVRVNYESEMGEEIRDSFVIFSKPCSRWSEKDKTVTVYLPKLELEDRQEADAGLGKIVINFKYKQDEKGFEAACLYAEDGIDGIFKPKPVKEIYFDEPFKIEIYSQNVKVFQVQVNNF